MIHAFFFALAADTPTEFQQYLSSKDLSYSYSIDSTEHKISLTSQTWQGMQWKHEVLYTLNNQAQYPGTAILFITGGNANSKLVDQIEGSAKMPLAVLFDIPNQPLYGGLKEDDLIAYTFNKYLNTHDASWPLLFPMTKSVIRTMDAIQDATKNTANPIHRFIISGASKRGWTTWLTGASKDPRVIGIAPMVIDNLNFVPQMKAQKSEWGDYSEQIAPYYESGFLKRLESGEANHLAAIVDPYTYRRDITQPTLIVKGANDPYWTVDALDRYWKELRMPKWVVTVPNAGHNLGGGAEAIETLGAFARSVAGKFKMPSESWDIRAKGGQCQVRLRSKGPKLVKFTIWMATSKNLDFRPSKYVPTVAQIDKDGHQANYSFSLPGENLAVFGEATYEANGSTFRLCSPTKLIPAVK